MVSQDPSRTTVIQGRYQLDEKLGEGGFGAVWSGVHLQMGTPVAVKLLHAQHAGTLEMTKRFELEARRSAALKHPNTIRVFDFGTAEDGSLYLAMELLEGLPLSKLMKREGALDPVRVVHILRQVLDALDEAHSHGLVHRDLKPDNIFLVKVGRDPDFVKVLDFGIAKALDANTQLTASGVVIGTPSYMSPEQCRGKELDHRSDLYSLGCIAFEMLSGSPPFKADSALGMVFAHVSEPPPDLRELVSDAPEALVTWIERCLAKAPGDRFASAEEAAAALPSDEAGTTGASVARRAASTASPASLTTGGLGAHRSSRREAQGGPSRSKAWWLGAGGVLVAGVVVAVAVASSGGRETDAPREVAPVASAPEPVIAVALEPSPRVEEPSPGAAASSRPTGAATPSEAPDTAVVEVVGFADFECAHSERASSTMAELQRRFGDKLTITWRHLPLPFHERARPAAIAAEAARRQGRFTEMHARLFANRAALKDADLRSHAEAIGLDLARFERDLADPAVAMRVDHDIAVARALNAHGTPTFFVNGRRVEGAQPIETFTALIDEELAAAGERYGRAFRDERAAANETFMRYVVRGETPPERSAAPDVSAAAEKAPVAPARRVALSSVPTGATVKRDGEALGKTPLELTWAEGESPRFTLELANHDRLALGPGEFGDATIYEARLTRTTRKDAEAKDAGLGSPKEGSAGSSAGASGEELNRQARAIQMSDPTAALALYEKAAAQGYVASYKSIGILKSQRGDKAGAIRAYTRYLQVRPQAKDAETVREIIVQLGGTPP